MLTRLSLTFWVYFTLIVYFICSVDAEGLKVSKAICGNREHSHQRIQHKIREACRSLPDDVNRLDALIAHPYDPEEFIADGKQYTIPGPFFIFPLGQEGTDQSYKGPDRIMINRDCQLATILIETRIASEKAKICFRKACNQPPVPRYRQRDFRYEECILHVVQGGVPGGLAGVEAEG